MIEYKQGVDARVFVRLLDSAAAPVTGVTYGSVTATVLKSDGTTASVTVTGGNWSEISTGAFTTEGLYTLVIPAATINVTGAFSFAVAVSGATTFIGAVKIVANEEVDTYTRIGAAVGASISADIAAIKADTGAINTETDAASIANAVWDASTTGNTTGGTMGGLLNGASAPPSAAVIADAVWDEAIGGHVSAGSTGLKLNVSGASGVQFYANGDTVAPIIVQVTSPKHTQVRITYSEPVVMTAGSNGALNLSNYSIPGLTLFAIASITPQQVMLTTSAQTANFLYTLDVSNVEDLVGNPIV